MHCVTVIMSGARGGVGCVCVGGGGAGVEGGSSVVSLGPLGCLPAHVAALASPTAVRDE